MMVQRRSSKDTVLLRVRESVSPLAPFERVPLDDHGHHLGDEYCADERQHELRLEEIATAPRPPPSASEPVSPMKTFAGYVLYQRNPMSAPTIEIQNTVSSPESWRYGMNRKRV